MVLALTLGLPSGWALAADWPQFDLDASHSGWSQQETTIHSANVSTLHVLYHVTLPSIADGAPALLTGVTTASGVKDLLFLTTKAGHVLALDAATGATVWSKQPATGPNYTTSSPAVDPNRQFVYSYALDGKVHKYQVGDGTEIMTGGWPQLTTLKPQVEKGSAALSLATLADGTSYLYVANGGYPGDAGDYQGHITAINLATGAQKVWNANCSDQTVHFTTTTPDCSAVQTAIWARPGVVFDSDNSRIFMATGNGNYDGNAGGHNWGDTVFALHPDGTGTAGLPVDAYTPTEFQQLQDADLDLGSTAPALLPTPATSNVARLGVQSGKDAKLRLLNLDDLSGAGGPGHLGGELQKIAVPQGGAVLTQPAVWVNPVDGQSWLFVANGSGISGLKLVVDGMGNPSLSPQWTSGTGGSSPIVVNGMVFYATFGGNLRALDPTSGTDLWNDPSIATIHWESPIVVNGRLYATDEGAMLWAFAPNAAPLSLFTLTPCRLVDTRQPNGPLGGPALAGNGAKRLFPLTGACGVPAGALALAANVTVISPTTGGTLRLTPAGFATPTTTISFNPGRIRSNNVALSLTGHPVGDATVEADLPGSLQLVIDVFGYFR